MTATPSTPSPDTGPQDDIEPVIAAALHEHQAAMAPTAVAAVQLLLASGMLRRPAVAAQVSIDGGLAVRWRTLLEVADASGPPWSSSQRRLLELAVSLAANQPVQLREALTGFGHVNARIIVDAVLTATGYDDCYELCARDSGGGDG